jgi:hypothetical protein
MLKSNHRAGNEQIICRGFKSCIDLNARRGDFMNLGRLSQCLVTPIVAFPVVGVMLVMAPQSASAQGIIVSNPFPFSVDDQQYPAGTYQFTLESQWLLSIHNAAGGNKNFFPIHPDDSGPLGSHSRLTFYNCEGNELLEAVYIPGTGITAELIASDSATNKMKTHGPRASLNCLPEKTAIRGRNAKGQ